MRNMQTVRPKRINDILVNPGTGFTTFQRFNGDDLNPGTKWTEGHPIEYQEEKPSLIRDDHPLCSIAYFRIYWKYLEPERGVYRWDIIDKALETARARGQELMLRVGPYGTGDDNDVPAWYREMVGPKRDWNGPDWNYLGPYWMVDANDPRYAQCFGGFIRELGKRYNNHPDLDSVDMSIVGSWGEGINDGRMTQETRVLLNDAYLDTFTQTPLMMLLAENSQTNKYPRNRRGSGFRFDCLGDMGEWEHMMRAYPYQMAANGLDTAWLTAPLSFEACWVMEHWRQQDWDVDYIIEQSLKWHMSSFNNKSSAVPDVWWPKVNDWLKKMGYRFALRRLEYEGTVKPGEHMQIAAWWENLGVAPCYKNYLLAYRLRNDSGCHMIISDADLLTFLPGDKLHKTAMLLPEDIPAGDYRLDVAIVDKRGYKPRVKLATEGLRDDGWYDLNAPVTVE